MSLVLRHLRAFTAVVDTGSIGGGARLLNVSQPALSRMIRSLEKEVQSPLLHRLSTGVELTEAGRVLLSRARLLLAEATEAVEELAALRGLSQATVRVGAVSSVLPRTVCRAVVEMLEQRPGLHVSIMEGVGDALVDALVNRHIDLAVAAELPANDLVAVVGAVHDSDAIMPAASARHPLALRGNVSPEDLIGQQWVMPPPPAPPRGELENLFDRLGLPAPEVVVETRSINALKALVIEGPYLTWLPRPIFRAEEMAGIIRPLQVPNLRQERKFVIYARRMRPLSTAAHLLLSILRRQPRVERSLEVELFH